jgi:hypothetical protein
MVVGLDNWSNGLISGVLRGFKGRYDAVGVVYDLVELPFNDAHGY